MTTFNSRKSLVVSFAVLATVALVAGYLAGVPAVVSPVSAACTTLPATGFDWTVKNVPYEATLLGEPGTRLQWDRTTTNYVGAMIKAKYETTEANAVWYCAMITGISTLSNCSGQTLAFPAGVLTISGSVNDPSEAPCDQGYSDGTPCTAGIEYELNFAKTDGSGRTLAQTYYWVDNSALPSAHDIGDCGSGQVYRYANYGPVYGHPCSHDLGAVTSCSPVLFEEARRISSEALRVAFSTALAQGPQTQRGCGP